MMKKRLCIIVTVLCISVLFAASANAEKLLYAANAEGEMALHLLPGETSPGIVQIPSCAQMRLIKTEGTWGLVNFQNKCGWINLSFTRETYDAAAEATGIECVKNVKIKSKDKNVAIYNLPSYDKTKGSKEKYTVPDGMIVKITRETSTGWGLVSISDEYAWVSLKDTKAYETPAEQSVSPYEIYYVYVLTKEKGALNMYSEAGQGSVLAIIPDCTKLTVRETKDNYAYVSYEGINGWINLEDTTTSLYYARSNCGSVVNKDFVTIAYQDSEKIPVFSIPYEEEVIGNELIGSIEGETRVFVQRATHKGWYLINHNGMLGWIPPQSAFEAPVEESEVVVFHKTPGEKYAVTQKGKGILMYADYDKEDECITVTEYIKVKTLAEKEEMVYIYSDYASGWVESENLYNSYKDALSIGTLEEKQIYHTLSKCSMMNLPANEDEYNCRKICDIEKNTLLEVRKFITTGKDKWVLVRNGDKTGFVKLSELKKGTPANKNLYAVYISSGIVFLLILCASAVYIVMKKRKQKIFKKQLTNNTDVVIIFKQ